MSESVVVVQNPHSGMVLGVCDNMERAERFVETSIRDWSWGEILTTEKKIIQ